MRELDEATFSDLVSRKFMRLSEILEAPTFLQVGAADGVITEDLGGAFTATDWSAVMMEPLPDMFARLQQTWAHKPKFQLVNAALAAFDGHINIRRIPPEHVRPEAAWEGGISSIDGARSAFTECEVDPAHAKMLTDRSRLDRVETITFDTLRMRTGLKRIDYLQIDTEGYDLIVTEQIDFVRYRPFLIKCEIFNLSLTDRAKLFGLLQGYGYQIDVWQFDLAAYLF